MHDLTAGPDAVLRYLQETAAGRPDRSRVIEHVRLCDENWRLPAGNRQVRDVLAVVPDSGALRLADPRPVLRDLVSGGVVAVALAVPPGASAPETAAGVAEMERMGLSLLIPATLPSDATTLHADVLTRQVVALRAASDGHSRLLRISAQLAPKGEGPEPLLRVLENECDASVQVIEPGDAGWKRLAEFERDLDQVRHGQIQTAALSAIGQHVILYAVGGKAPHPVLAAVRSTPWPRPLRDLVAQATGQISLLKDLSGELRLRQNEMAVRRSILRFLMSGEPDSGRVAVVECALGEDRNAVALECEEAIERRGVVVLCPSERRHVIMVWGDDGRKPTEVLAPIARAGRAVGISSAARWEEFADLYERGFHSLAAARQARDGMSVDEGRPRLASLLPPAARTWARTRLAPLDTLPEDYRDKYVKTARLTLSKGAEHAGNRGGITAETASRRLTAVMEHLGLSRQSLSDQTVLELAFELARLAPPREGDGRTVTLHHLLKDADEARAEAKRFLAPLDGAPELRGLLITWFKCNGHKENTAKAVGKHRNSIAPRLDRAGALLSRQLTHDGAGSFDVLLALVLIGELDARILVRDPLLPGGL